MAEKKIQPKQPAAEKSAAGSRKTEKVSAKAVKPKKIAPKKIAPKKY
jgi:hypothetical protein